MNYVVIRHQVANFNDWKEVYDKHASARAAAGLKEEHVLSNVDHKNEVVLIYSANDLNKAKEFGSSADLRQAMQIAGVTDAPDVYFLTDAK